MPFRDSFRRSFSSAPKDVDDAPSSSTSSSPTVPYGRNNSTATGTTIATTSTGLTIPLSETNFRKPSTAASTVTTQTNSTRPANAPNVQLVNSFSPTNAYHIPAIPSLFPSAAPLPIKCLTPHLPKPLLPIRLKDLFESKDKILADSPARWKIEHPRRLVDLDRGLVAGMKLPWSVDKPINITLPSSHNSTPSRERPDSGSSAPPDSKPSCRWSLRSITGTSKSKGKAPAPRELKLWTDDFDKRGLQWVEVSVDGSWEAEYFCRRTKVRGEWVVAKEMIGVGRYVVAVIRRRKGGGCVVWVDERGLEGRMAAVVAWAIESRERQRGWVLGGTLS